MEKFKQLDDLICAEINVKNIRREVCTTDKGGLVLNYDGIEREYTFLLNEKDVTSPKLLKMVPKITGYAKED